MDEDPDQIIGHIEAQRSELGRNLSELETRVRASTDWRTYFDRNPGLAMGAALGGGLLLGVMVSSKRHSSPSYRSHSSSSKSYAGATAAGGALGLKSSSSRSSSISSPVTSMQLKHISETMDHVKAALIAFGISKAKEFISQAIPGLDSHLNEAEQRGRQHSSGPSSSQNWQSSSAEPSTAPPTGGSHSWQSAGAQHHEPTPAAL